MKAHECGMHNIIVKRLRTLHELQKRGELKGHNRMHFAIGDINCNLEFKLRYLKKLNLFSIRVKE